MFGRESLREKDFSKIHIPLSTGDGENTLPFRDVITSGGFNCKKNTSTTVESSSGQ